jgi:hypothetical protein
LTVRSTVAQLFGIDLRSLALFRVSLGVMLLADLAWRARDLEAFYTDFGVLPRSHLAQAWSARWYLCLHAWSGGSSWQAVLFLAAAVFAVLLAVGFKTRLATAASWVLLISLQNRNPPLTQGGDMLLRMLLFWCLFLPLGARNSLDARRLRSSAPAPEEPRYALSAATAAALLQVAFVYWFGVASKRDPAWMTDGMAIWLALNLDQFATPLGIWMRHLPPLLLRLMTYLTMLLEGLFPTLAFLPLRRAPQLRTAVVFVFWFFHLVALNLTLHLGHFPWVCAIAWMLFLPTWFWDVLAQRPRKPEDGEPAALGLPRPVNAVVLVLLLYVALWNVRNMSPGGFRNVIPPPLDRLADTTRIDQLWIMFSPHPPVDDGWFVFPATLRDGTKVDLYREVMGTASAAPQPDVDWTKPGLVSETFRDERWRKYLMALNGDRNRFHRPWLADYLRRRWDRDHGADPARQVAALQLCFMKETTPEFPGEAFAPLEKMVLFEKSWALTPARPAPARSTP